MEKVMVQTQFRKIFSAMNGGEAPPPDEKDLSKSGRRVRPEIQIYRPGMMRKGTDITANSPSETGEDKEQRDSRHASSQSKRPPRGPNENRAFTRTYENSGRRRQSDEYERNDSRRDSGSTTPDANERYYKSSQGKGGQNNRRNDRDRLDTRSDYGGGYRNQRGGGGGSGYSSRNGSQYGGSRDDLNSEASYDGGRRHHNYNSTQSLLDPRPQPGGYLDYRGDQPRSRTSQNPYQSSAYSHGPSRPPPRQLNRVNRPSFERNTERASMRAENLQRRGTGRRRNDSLNSTQSERPASMFVEPPDQLETRSTAGDAPAISFSDLCASFESMGSLDWSQIVEQDFAAPSVTEESNKNELKERLEECHREQRKEEESALRENRQERPVLRNGRGRGRGIRQRHDSDRSSSIASESIAEELSDTENADGERTPTYSQSYGERRRGRGGASPRSYDRRDNLKGPPREYQPKFYGGSDQHEKRNDRRSYRSNHDDDRYSVDEERPQGGKLMKGRISYEPASSPAVEASSIPSQAAPTSRLKGRLSMGGSGGVYQPPAMRIQSRASTGSSQSTPRGSVDDRDSQMPRTSTDNRMDEFSVYQEIAQDEGPRIEQINNEISAILPKVQKRDMGMARKLIEMSSSLSEIYFGIMTRDVNFTYSMNLESHLWKQAYHKLIETMRTGSNSSSDGAIALREALKKLIRNGIDFYKRLLALYETDLDISIGQCLLWPAGLPIDDLRTVYQGVSPICKYENNVQKIAIKSASRHLICLGDLNRYLSIIEASEDHSRAKGCYLRAAQLYPASGHAYNQLAVLAYTSMLYRSRLRMRLTPVHVLSDQRQEKVIDEIFFIVRALAAGHPFDAAKERMTQRLAAMRRKVEKYEPLLDSELGRSKGGEAELAQHLDRPSEMWVRPNGEIERDKEGVESETMEHFKQQQPSKLYRRTVSYLVATASLLLSKIGMEMFQSVSERSLCQLSALLQQSDSPMTALQLVQLTAVFLYSVQYTDRSGDADTCSLQQQQAVRFVMSLWGVLLRPVVDQKDDVGKWLKGEESAPYLVLRVLPALSLISDWMTSHFANKIIHSMPTLEPLSTSVLSLDTWAMLAELANTLNEYDLDGTLPKEGMKLKNTVPIILPELAMVASFSNIYPSLVKPIDMQKPSTDKSLLALQCRLRAIFTCCECMDGCEMRCFTYDLNSKSFIRRDMADGDRVEIEALQRKKTISSSDPEDAAPSARNALLEDEKRRRGTVMVVSPQYILPDTNAFVDHLDGIQKVVDSGRYTVLVSTIVIDELVGLSQSPRPHESEEHAEYVLQQAKRGVQWLKEQSKLRNSRLGTVTTRGQKHQMSMLNEDTSGGYGQVNDDRIVSTCVAFSALCPALMPSGIALPSDSTPIARSLILISEDRGVQIKAAVHQIPSRTLPSFLKWAGI